jgi:hypothetical protein
MNAEKLHDALNYLDDSMILETDRLRHKKKKTVIFRRFISIAACICIVATTVFGIGHMRSIKENSPLDENFEASQNNGDIPPAPENSQSTENQPPAPDNSDPSYNPAPPTDESAPEKDPEQDENSESAEESASTDESAPEEESAPAEEMPPLEEDPPAEEAPPVDQAPPTEDSSSDEKDEPEWRIHKLVVKVTHITEDGFKGYVRNENNIYSINEYVTVISNEREKPEIGGMVDVYFYEYDGYTVYAERIFVVKE